MARKNKSDGNDILDEAVPLDSDEAAAVVGLGIDDKGLSMANGAYFNRNCIEIEEVDLPVNTLNEEVLRFSDAVRYLMAITGKQEMQVVDIHLETLEACSLEDVPDGMTQKGLLDFLEFHEKTQMQGNAAVRRLLNETRNGALRGFARAAWDIENEQLANQREQNWGV